jgi:ubiquinone/menaquinone biosynthesis C-methylase UbiE
MHVRKSGSPRSWSEFVLRELDLRPGDAVVDVGAGDGWWAEKIAKLVGKEGIVHAAEIDEKKIDEMRSKYSNVPQIRPYLCEKDSTSLPEGSCDMAFFCQSYHHLDENGRRAYLKALKKVVKPGGRIVIVDKYALVASSNRRHAVDLSVLLEEAEGAGWILVRCELLTGTQHYMATFVQKELVAQPRRGRV